MSERRPSRRREGSTRLQVGPTAHTSIVRTGLALLLAVVGIAWITVFTVVDPQPGGDKLRWMGDLENWNYLIGFGVFFLGLAVAAHPSTPLGRGRGVVIGMLGSFLIGLIWIVTYYVIGQNITVPLLSDLAQYNLVVGIGFMAVGFIYATHWE